MHRHDDDHHHHDHALGAEELTRRRVLYLFGAGLLTPMIPTVASSAATRTTRPRSTPTSRSTPSTRPTPTSRPGGSSTPAAVHDPWALFPDTVRATRTGTSVIVESNGLPQHPMMIGIRSWQQQVPLPQAFTGSNAFRLPLTGSLSDNPISGRHALYRGAIALAVNGVPIFNALNNRGEDAFLFGELDQWGGHCGRADDYHYHVAPLHLQAVTGPATPIAFALDGYPLYGLTEPDGSAVRPLDEFNGHADAADGYHYHATLGFPYINGGLRGKVTVRNDGVEPQPVTTPVRPPGEPLRGAVITGFTTDGTASRLEYTLGGGVYRIDYAVTGSEVRLTRTDPNGAATTEIFRRR